MTLPSVPPVPSRAFLQELIRKGAARGIPVQVAEDLVMESWGRAAAAFDPQRGSFEALLLRVTENAYRYWWRVEVREGRFRAALVDEATASPGPGAGDVGQRAQANQQRLLEALEPDEQRLFATWALQQHLPRGTFTAEAAARSLDLHLGAYDHARRRLRRKILALLDDWGLQPRDLWTVEDDERPRRRHER